eukprot:g14172.t1
MATFLSCIRSTPASRRPRLLVAALLALFGRSSCGVGPSPFCSAVVVLSTATTGEEFELFGDPLAPGLQRKGKRTPDPSEREREQRNESATLSLAGHHLWRHILALSSGGSEAVAGLILGGSDGGTTTEQQGNDIDNDRQHGLEEIFPGALALWFGLRGTELEEYQDWDFVERELVQTLGVRVDDPDQIPVAYVLRAIANEAKQWAAAGVGSGSGMATHWEVEWGDEEDGFLCRGSN